MSNQPNVPAQSPAGVCAFCIHDLAPHVMLAVIERPVLAGLTLCPETGCGCMATWRAGATRSTPDQIAETRRLIREELEAAGIPVPRFLR